MNIAQIKALVQMALDLKSGESISIPVPSKGQALSIRTMFYRERKNLLENRGIELSASVRVEQDKNGNWEAQIFCDPPIMLRLNKEGGEETKKLEIDAVTLVKEEDIPDDIKEILEKHRAGVQSSNQVKN